MGTGPLHFNRLWCGCGHRHDTFPAHIRVRRQLDQGRPGHHRTNASTRLFRNLHCGQARTCAKRVPRPGDSWRSSMRGNTARALNAHRRGLDKVGSAPQPGGSAAGKVKAARTRGWRGWPPPDDERQLQGAGGCALYMVCPHFGETGERQALEYARACAPHAPGRAVRNQELGHLGHLWRELDACSTGKQGDLWFA